MSEASASRRLTAGWQRLRAFTPNLHLVAGRDSHICEFEAIGRQVEKARLKLKLASVRRSQRP
jgi:hypothetical protein